MLTSLSSLLHIYLLSYLHFGSAANLCDVPVRIQLMQIQDGTSSFTEDIKYMNQFMEDIIVDLSDRYGPVEFGLTSYTDKPQYITGSGRNEGVWKDYNYSVTDYCYDLNTPMKPRAPNYSNVVQGGGKDSKENQFEALYKSVIDPDAGWDTRQIDDEGYLVIKLALLITDGASHRNSAYDMDEENRNWYKEELLLGPCNYKDEGCKEWHGDSTSRTGVDMSLKGLVSHYRHFSKRNDAEMYINYEMYGWKHMSIFNEWKYCCKYYNVFPQVLATTCSHFPTWESCSKASCKDCKKCDAYCANDPEFEISWIKEVEVPELDIKPFQYGPESLNQDCATTEYPDPFDERYAQAFIDKGVTPMLFIRKPSKELQVLSGFWPFSIEDLQLANACPIVGQRLSKYWLCYSDIERQREGGISKSGGCEGYDPKELSIETFYEDCLREHYGEPLKKMKEYGVKEPSFKMVSSDVKQKELLDQMKKFITDNIELNGACKTTTAAAITTVVTTTTTVATVPVVTLSDTNTEEESSVGVIVGAAAGGVAGLAAMAAGVMMKGMPGEKTYEDVHVEEADLNNAPLQREQMAEINANMFL